MAPLHNPQNEKHPNTYFVQQREQKDELLRLDGQGQMLTMAMGGPLSEQIDASIFRSGIDIACGTGEWLIAAAQSNPLLDLVGIDINPLMIDYATRQMAAQQLTARVSLHMMDALKSLDFAAESFDLVNQRLGQSYIRTWEWPKLLSEYQHICKPGGVIRVTEVETVSQSSSAAVVQLGRIFTLALHSAGHYFSPESHGITSHLPRLFQAAGLREVQTRSYYLECRAGTSEGEHFAEDVKHLFRAALPFFQKWTQVPENYEEIYQQALSDMQQPDFMAHWNVYTVWSKK